MHRVHLPALLVLLLAAPPLAAQQRVRVNGALETGAAAIEQPLVRGGGALYVAPSASLTARDATIGATAVLAAGSPTWQSFLGTLTAQSPARHNLRVTAGGQVLKTSGLLHTLHADAGLEWRAARGDNAAAARIATGQLSHAGAWWPDLSAGVSVARTRGALAVAVDASYTDARRPAALQAQIGSLTSLTYNVATGEFTNTSRAQVLDFTPRMIWERSRLRADASLALRAAQGGVTGKRVGPQLAFTLQTSRGLSLFAGAAQRLPDVRSGVPSGRTAVLGVRLEGRRLLASSAKTTALFPALRIENSALLVDAGDGTTARVELRGDFTEWQTRSCMPRGRRYFDCGTVPPTGTWRVSIRLDGGAWQHPANLTPAVDDFGTVDGVLQTGAKP